MFQKPNIPVHNQLLRGNASPWAYSGGGGAKMAIPPPEFKNGLNSYLKSMLNFHDKLLTFVQAGAYSGGGEGGRAPPKPVYCRLMQMQFCILYNVLTDA